MTYRKFFIKDKCSWSKKFEWNPDSKKLYYNNSYIGEAPSLQDAIDLSKRHYPLNCVNDNA